MPPTCAMTLVIQRKLMKLVCHDPGPALSYAYMSGDFSFGLHGFVPYALSQEILNGDRHGALWVEIVVWFSAPACSLRALVALGKVVDNMRNDLILHFRATPTIEFYRRIDVDAIVAELD